MKTIAQNDLTEVVAEVGYRNRESLMLHERTMLDSRARHALELIRAWGMVAARPAGPDEMRDDRGLTLLSVSEVVTRACEMVEASYAEFAKRGWQLEVGGADKLFLDD